MPSDTDLAKARSAIREFVDLGEDNSDLALIAATLANFDPQRAEPIWLVFIARAGSPVADLVSLGVSWPSAHLLPPRISSKYLPGPGNALDLMRKRGQSMLLSLDMTALTTTNRYDTLMPQLTGVFDGLLRTAGWQWGPRPPAERPGLLGVMPEHFYSWRRQNPMLGSRFVPFVPLRRSWTTPRASALAGASMALSAFLRTAAGELARNPPQARIQPADADRLAMACSVARRIAGDDSGRMLSRILTLVRITAFAGGLPAAGDREINLGIAFALSQIAPLELELLEILALEEGNGWLPLRRILQQRQIRREGVPSALRAIVDSGLVEVKGSGPSERARFVIARDAERKILTRHEAQTAQLFDPELESLVSAAVESFEGDPEEVPDFED